MGSTELNPEMKLLLKIPNFFFSRVGAVIMGGNKLEGVFVSVLNEGFQSCWALIVHSVMFRAEAFCSEKSKNILVDSTMLMFRLVTHGSGSNVVSIKVIGHIKIFVTTTGDYWEPTSKVCSKQILF